jgi:hypothetical protein
MTIRVIGFRLEVTADDGSTRTERYRLITTLLDWRAFPAAGLAAAYARRWAIERSKPGCCHKPGYSSSPVPSGSGLALAA